MSQNKERIQILSEVRRGELDIPSAITRLQSLSGRVDTPETERQQSRGNRELRIVRTEIESDKVLMDIRIAVDLLDAAERVGAELTPYLALIPAESFAEALTTPGLHKLVDQVQEEQGEQLEVFLE